MSKDAEFKDLLGEILTGITGAEAGSERVTFQTASGRAFEQYHEQDCCEHVVLDEVIGDVADLIGTPIMMVDESSNSEERPDECESHTWTFYKLATIKGYVTLRWLGSSNGYYSESVSFVETTSSPIKG